MDVRIVRANIEHLKDIALIEELSFPIPWSIDSIKNEFEANTRAVYLAAVTEHGKAVGYAGMWDIVGEGHITNIAVHPDCRNKGIASKLLDEIIACAKKRNIKSLTLEVRKSNIAAISLYKKFGFVEYGIRKGYYEDNGEDAIIMWKYL